MTPAPLANVLHYLASSFLLKGALLAVEIAALAMVIGLLLGFSLAMMRLSRIAALSGAAWFYIWFIRGTPLLLQLVFIYDALPAVGITLDTFTTAVLGFALNEAAFSAEIIRGGILAVNRDQGIAAAALGMPPSMTLRRIILPQAMRGILPGIANQAISMIKGTSIASVIFVNELTFRAEQIVGQNFQFFTVFAAAGAIYLVLTSMVAVAQVAAERRFDFLREPVFRARAAAHRAGPPLPASSSGADLPALIGELCPSFAPDGAGPFVACRNVRKAYGDRVVLRDVDFEVARGEVVVIIGPSGSGKSTLLRLINHLDALDGGEITVDGSLVGYRRTGEGRLRPSGKLAKARADARIGMVFQHFNLFEHITAIENVMEAPVRVQGQAPAQARTTALRLLAGMGLASHADHRPHRLSGGQKQRIAIARALAMSPRLMLFDEPTSALDPELVGEVLGVIRGLAQGGMTLIIVTHEVRFAREVADRVVFMDDGVIVEQGPPDRVLDRPSHERTRRFLRLVEGQDAPQAPQGGLHATCRDELDAGRDVPAR